jgi:hypothetical protein
MGIGFPGQQGIGISAGTAHVVAEPDDADITLGTLVSVLG